MKKLKDTIIKYKYAWPLMLVASLSFNLFLNMTQESPVIVNSYGFNLDVNAFYQKVLKKQESNGGHFTKNIFNAFEYIQNSDGVLAQYDDIKQQQVAAIKFKHIIHKYDLSAFEDINGRNINEVVPKYISNQRERGVYSIVSFNIASLFLLKAREEYSIDTILTVYYNMISHFEATIIKEMPQLNHNLGHTQALLGFMIQQMLAEYSEPKVFKVHYLFGGYALGLKLEYLPKIDSSLYAAYAQSVQYKIIPTFNIFDKYEYKHPAIEDYSAVYKVHKVMLENIHKHRAQHFIWAPSHLEMAKVINAICESKFITEYIESIPSDLQAVVQEGFRQEMDFLASPEYVKVATVMPTYPVFEMANLEKIDEARFREAAMLEEEAAFRKALE